MRTENYSYEIIIIDDDSNDGTPKAVDMIRDKYNINLITRKNVRGLSSAVIEGFRQATGEIIVVMDADLSHPPEKIARLVEPILNNKAEFVIGSRFVKGGSALHFNIYRRLNASISRLLARPFTRVKDPMAGFFAFPRVILKPDIDLNPQGFKIGLELIVKAAPKKIVEIPIKFQERLHGESKLSLKEQMNYIIHIKRLYQHKYRTRTEFLLFSIIGGSGVVVDLSFVYIAKEVLSMEFRLARIMGFVIALTSNFFLNRRFAFKNSIMQNIVRQYILFFIVCVAGLSVNWLISVYLYENVSFFHNHYLIASLAGILGGTFNNFIGCKMLVFKK